MTATPPADPPPSDTLTDTQKLDIVYQHITWLTTQVHGLLLAMNSNPAFRMMMGRKRP